MFVLDCRGGASSNSYHLQIPSLISPRSIASVGGATAFPHSTQTYAETSVKPAHVCSLPQWGHGAVAASNAEPWRSRRCRKRAQVEAELAHGGCVRRRLAATRSLLKRQVPLPSVPRAGLLALIALFARRPAEANGGARAVPTARLSPAPI